MKQLKKGAKHDQQKTRFIELGIQLRHTYQNKSFIVEKKQNLNMLKFSNFIFFLLSFSYKNVYVVYVPILLTFLVLVIWNEL